MRVECAGRRRAPDVAGVLGRHARTDLAAGVAEMIGPALLDVR
jgi:hypothetical protein